MSYEKRHPLRTSRRVSNPGLKTLMKEHNNHVDECGELAAIMETTKTMLPAIALLLIMSQRETAMTLQQIRTAWTKISSDGQALHHRLIDIDRVYCTIKNTGMVFEKTTHYFYSNKDTLARVKIRLQKFHELFSNYNFDVLDREVRQMIAGATSKPYFASDDIKENLGNLDHYYKKMMSGL